MKRIEYIKFGGPEVLQVKDFDLPEPKDNQVQIKTHFAGINFAEIMTRMGLYPGAPKPPSPIGGEASGVIEKIGSNVTGFNKGDAVMAFAPFNSYSSHINIDQNMLFNLPENFTMQQGAAFPVIYLTAYMMMFNLGNFQKDETILIHGVGGGVGTAAIQLAQAVGGNIIGTASKWKHKKLNEMGVENCIDYTNENVHEKVMQFTNNRGVDVIIDPVGSDNWKISYECLAPLGKMIIFGDQNFVKGKSFNLFALMKEIFSMPKYKPMDLMSKNKSVMGYHLGRLAGAEDKIQKAASKLHDLAQTGKIKPIIDQVFPFTDAPLAHEHIQNRKNFGKVLLDFNDK